MPFDSIVDVSSLNGNNGFVVDGNSIPGAGCYTASRGDINGDGIDDLLLGSYTASNNAGTSYVIFGSRQPFNARFNLANLNGANGFLVNGISSNSFSGGSIASGDINGDGITDLLIGAYGTNSNAGAAYVVFGSRQPFYPNVELSGLNGSNGFAIRGSSTELLGIALDSGDINGDGIDDVIVGASYASNYRGTCYVIFGSRQPFSPSLSMTSLTGMNGFKVSGVNSYTFLGGILSSGDVNGDGVDDLLFGASSTLLSPTSTVAGYVVFGSRQLSASLSLTELNGSNGFIIDSTNRLTKPFSISINSGDMNGDGMADILLGMPRNNVSTAGYILYGSRQPFSTYFQLNSLNGNNGVIIKSDSTITNYYLSQGKVNGDTAPDLLIGTSTFQSSSAAGDVYSASSAYVLFGSAASLNTDFLLPNQRISKGFEIRGINPKYTSYAIISQADINGDKTDDTLIGVCRWSQDSTVLNDASYVIFGTQSRVATTSNEGTATSSASRQTPWTSNILTSVTEAPSWLTSKMVNLLSSEAAPYAKETTNLFQGLPTRSADFNATILLGMTLWQMSKNAVNGVWQYFNAPSAPKLTHCAARADLLKRIDTVEAKAKTFYQAEEAYAHDYFRWQIEDLRADWSNTQITVNELEASLLATEAALAKRQRRLTQTSQLPKAASTAGFFNRFSQTLQHMQNTLPSFAALTGREPSSLLGSDQPTLPSTLPSLNR